MNRLLFSCLILTYLGTSYVKAAENLCPNETFKFENYEVNQFHQIKLNFTLKPVGHYMLKVDLDFNDYFNTTIGSKLNQLKSGYQSSIMKVYSESTMNDKKERFTIRKWKSIVLTYKKGFQEMKEKMKGSEQESLLAEIEKFCSKGLDLIDLLSIFGRSALNKTLVSYDEFETLLKNVPINRQNEVLVFEHKTLDAYYTNLLFKMDRFKFNRYSEIFYDPKSNGEIFYSVYIPIQNKNYDSKKTPCTPVSDLPLFFLFKGGK